MTDPLRALLDRIATGRFPDPDGHTVLLGRPPGIHLAGAVLSFTAHGVVAADIDEPWVRGRLPAHLGAETSAAFLAALAQKLDTRAGSLDLVLVAPAGAPGTPAAPAASSGGVVAGGSGYARPPTTGNNRGVGADSVARGGVGGWRPGVRQLAATVRAPTAAEPVLPQGVRPLAGTHPRVERAHRYRDGVRAYATDGGVVILGRGLAGRWEIAVEVEPAYRGRGIGRRLAALGPALAPAGEPLWAQVAPGNVASVRAFLAAGYRPVGAEVLFPVSRWEDT